MLVDLPDSDHLDDGNDEDDEASPEVVHQLENGLTTGSDVDRANSEADEADYACDSCLNIMCSQTVKLSLYKLKIPTLFFSGQRSQNTVMIPVSSPVAEPRPSCISFIIFYILYNYNECYHRDQHEEEEDGEELWEEVKLGEGGGVADKGQAGPGVHHVTDGDAQLVSQTPQDGEDDEPGEEGGEGVGEADDEGVSVGVVLEVVIRGVGDQRPEPRGEREE